MEVDHRTILIPLRGKLFEDRRWAKNPVAVGDRVKVSIGDGGGVIEAVLPRTSKLARKASGEDSREQVIAANVTQVLIVTAIREPPFQPALVDRILAGCERQELSAVIVLTKIDRDRGDARDEWLQLYHGLGYEILATSIEPGHETEDSLEQLRRLLHANVSVLTGLSGVGKSSMLNYLIPGLELRIGSMSRIRQGKHTTSHAQLMPLHGGGHVLDTPGIRNFGLFGVAPGELTFYFRELKALAPDCDYRNCAHLVEPGCAVRAAVERGEVHRSRYGSYVALAEELRALEQREHD